MKRIGPLIREEMSPRQQEVYDALVAGPRGAVQGPLEVWLHRPELAACAQALGRYCRYETALPKRLSELAIITTGRLWGSEFEWAIHKPIALEAGVDPEIVEAIRVGRRPHFEDVAEAAVYDFSSALHLERRVSDEIYARSIALLGEDGVVDLTGLLGYYTLISMTINVFEVELPDGMKPELS